MRITVPESGNYTFAARPSTSTSDDDGRRLAATPSSATVAPDGTVSFAWEVDLSRPETKVVSRPNAVTTEGNAVFEFACEVDREESDTDCSYEYQMARANSAEVDWDSLDWLPTVRTA